MWLWFRSSVKTKVVKKDKDNTIQGLGTPKESSWAIHPVPFRVWGLGFRALGLGFPCPGGFKVVCRFRGFLSSALRTVFDVKGFMVSSPLGPGDKG